MFALLVFGCDSAAALAEGVRPAADAVPAIEALGVEATAESAFDVAQLFSAGLQPVVTGWESTPERLLSGQCSECHSRTHAAWAGSMHARAWSDPVFLRAFELEPRQWCKNCHSPLQAAHTGTLPLAEGINCATCHVRGGQILGTHQHAARAGGHAVVRVSGFASEAVCEGCHQFNFPERHEPIEYSDVPMQNTLVEWRQAGSRACAQCHDQGHAVRGPHDAAWLTQQVKGASLDSVQAGVLSLVVDLQPRAHAMPTGDNFHSFVLEVATEPAFANVLARKRYGRELGVGFDSPFQVSDRALLRDTSLPADAAGMTLTFDRPNAARIFARLRFFQHDSFINGRSSAEAASAITAWQGDFSLGPL
jgi:hypothetical protein